MRFSREFVRCDECGLTLELPLVREGSRIEPASPPRGWSEKETLRGYPSEDFCKSCSPKKKVNSPELDILPEDGE